MKRIRPFALLLFFFIFYLWNTKDLFLNDHLYGRFDWDMYSFHVEFLRKSFLEFGTTFPLWNPYYGAGFPVWENPTSKVGSFTHLFAVLFPTLTALKISFLFYFILSGILNFLSFRLYTKSNTLASLLFVFVFQFSGFVFQKFYAGHLNQIPGLFLPALVFYILYFVKNGNWGIAITATAITYILLSEGSIYPLSQTFTFSFLFRNKGSVYIRFSERIHLSFYEIKRICFVCTFFQMDSPIPIHPLCGSVFCWRSIPVTWERLLFNFFWIFPTPITCSVPFANAISVLGIWELPRSNPSLYFPPSIFHKEADGFSFISTSACFVGYGRKYFRLLTCDPPKTLTNLFLGESVS